MQGSLGTDQTGAAEGDMRELEDIIVCAMLRMLRSWPRLDASARLELIKDVVRIGRHYQRRQRDLPRWLHEFLRELALRQRELMYDRHRPPEKEN